MIFVDTGFLLALAQPNDALHPRALDWSAILSEPLLVTEYVLVETVNNLSKRADRPRASQILKMISQDADHEIIHASRELFVARLRLHGERSAKDWSLTDCISFQVMREHGIIRALAYDIHFEQAGFEALLRRNPAE